RNGSRHVRALAQAERKRALVRSARRGVQRRSSCVGFAAERWVWAVEMESPGAKFVLLALARFADESGFCYPGQPRLAQITGFGERTVRRHLGDLERRGLIRRAARHLEDGTRTSDLYRLMMSPSDGEPAANLAAGERGSRALRTGHVNRPLPARQAANLGRGL